MLQNNLYSSAMSFPMKTKEMTQNNKKWGKQWQKTAKKNIQDQ